MQFSKQAIKGEVSVKFHGEDGQDAGGLTREWFEKVSVELFQPTNKLFAR
jgi:E3 ubiquitin-protein ligase HUWE1